MEGPQPLPEDEGGHSRRAALKLGVAGALGVAVGVGASAGLTRLWRAAPPRHRFFTDAEAALLVAICEQIVPRDDTPGATDAGVLDYIDRQLCGPLARHQAAYRRGLESFQGTCLELYQRPFEQLSFENQTEALRRIEAGKAPKELWDEPSAKGFFGLVLDHTMQGFYGSPRHGGNRDYTSYRMLGLSYPNLIGQNRYGRIRDKR